MVKEKNKQKHSEHGTVKGVWCHRAFETKSCTLEKSSDAKIFKKKKLNNKTNVQILASKHWLTKNKEKMQNRKKNKKKTTSSALIYIMHITDYKANEVQCGCTDTACSHLQVMHFYLYRCVVTRFGNKQFKKKKKGKKDIVQNIFLFCNTISIY